jgi:hypothetical protein
MSWMPGSGFTIIKKEFENTNDVDEARDHMIAEEDVEGRLTVFSGDSERQNEGR